MHGGKLIPVRRGLKSGGVISASEGGTVASVRGISQPQSVVCANTPGHALKLVDQETLRIEKTINAHIVHQTVEPIEFLVQCFKQTLDV